MSIRDSLVWDMYLQSEADTLAWEQEHKDKPPRLFVGSIGGCPRQAYFSAFKHIAGHPLQYDISHPFPEEVVELLELGKELEDRTWTRLERQYGQANGILRSISVGDDIWAGRTDFLIGPCLDYPRAAVVEHKGTSPWNFTAKDRLPYASHCLQVLAYQYLAQKQYGVKPDAVLYYRCWNMWAEFQVQRMSVSLWDEESSTFIEGEENISYNGRVNGKPVTGVHRLSLRAEMGKLEARWPPLELPAIPYSSPDEADFACTKRKGGEISCRWYGHCWGERSPDGP